MLIQAHGFKLYAEELGKGIPLLCLPAFPFDSRMFRHQHALADAARLILPDYRGTGRSELAGEGASSLYALADDMFNLLDHLNLDRSVVLGVSLGGYVALAMFAKLAHRIRGLILADTRSDADGPQDAERRQETIARLRAEGSSILSDRVNALFSESARREQPDLVASAQAQAAQTPAEGLARLTLGMASRPDRNELLPRIDVPALVIAGEEDTVTPPDLMRRMAGKIVMSDFQVLPKAGHLSPLEQPQAFNRLVRSYLAKLPPEPEDRK